MSVYLTLFISAFLSATLLPGSSEILLATLLNQGHDELSLWMWATTGNTLGSVINWLLGRYLLKFQHHRWFPFKEHSLKKAQRWFKRYGYWSLLLAWAPVVGDGLTFIAGVMKLRFDVFIVLTAAGKGLRYAILLGLFSWLMS